MYNDLTFFTNKEEQTLLDRFNKILRNSTQYFDVLVGYFRTSGFYNLYESMEDIERIRILVGINADIKTIELIDKAKNEQIKLNLSTKEIRDEFTGEIIKEFEESEDSEEVEKGAIKFIEFIKSYNSQSRPQIMELFKLYSDKNIFIFNNRKEADEFLVNLKR